MRNYIDISKENHNDNIYRVLSISKLIDMLEKRENVLVKPELWDDPFENFIYNLPIRKEDGAKSPLRNRAYGQCWTRNIESDAMWRIYASNNDGVKIRTTIKKLFKSLYDSQNEYANISSYIGAVKYVNKDIISKLVNDRLEQKGKFKGSIGQARSLLFKRNAFRYENEIRLIFLHPNNVSQLPTYSYSCDMFKLIDKITFDPRMSKSVYRIFKGHIKELGFNDEMIKSGLYNVPKF